MRIVWVLIVGILGPACKPDEGITRDLGAPCVDDGDCTTRCLPGPRWPQGFCSLGCAGPSDCPAGASCADTVDGDVCLFACFDDGDCGFLEDGIDDDWACRQLVCAPTAVQ